MSHSYYPLFLDLTGRVAVVIGGGAVAARKAESLHRAGARVIVVAPHLTAAFDAVPVELRRRPYEPQDLDEAALVFAATDDPAVNESVARACRERSILVNVADDPERCDFLVPAVVERGAIQIAISTSGQSPALARRIKSDLQQTIGEEYAEVSAIFGRLRERAQASPKLPRDRDRKRFFADLLARGILELLRDGRRDEAYAIIRAACAEAGIDEEL